jgi:hypothetical protein
MLVLECRERTRQFPGIVIVPRTLVERRLNTYILTMKESLKDRQERQAIEGVQAMADYRAAEKATLAKTARLKADRLARKAVIVPEAPKKKATARKRLTEKIGLSRGSHGMRTKELYANENPAEAGLPSSAIGRL